MLANNNSQFHSKSILIFIELTNFNKKHCIKNQLYETKTTFSFNIRQ
jgi:hypothetical protein